MPYRIKLAKENFKFSCSHFTILGPDRAERLHGHNYYLQVEIGVSGLNDDLGLAFDFNAVKPAVRALTQTWDEFVLLPELSPYLKLTFEPNAVRATMGTRVYVFPESDVRVLPVSNVTSEELARLVTERLSGVLKATLHEDSFALIETISVTVEETRGQSVSYESRPEQVIR